MSDDTTSYTMRDIDQARWDRIKDGIPRSAGSLQEGILGRLEALSEAHHTLPAGKTVLDVLSAVSAGAVGHVSTDDRGRARLRNLGAEPDSEYLVIVVEGDDD